MAKPLPPTLVKFVRSDDRMSCFLSWDSVLQDVDGNAATALYYEVYASAANNGLHYVLAATVTPTIGVRQYAVLDGLPGPMNPDALYTVKVAAITADGISDFSEEVTDY